MKTITIVAIIAAVAIVGAACIGIPLSGVLNGGTTGPGGDTPVQPTETPVEPTPTPTVTPTPTPTSTPMSYFSGGGSKSDSGSSSGGDDPAPCNHVWGDEWKSNNDGTHAKVCTLCSAKSEAVECHYGEYQHAEEAGTHYHYKVCTDCGYETTHVACTIGEFEPDTTGKTHSKKCSECYYVTETGNCDTDSITKLGKIEGVYSHERTCSVCSSTPVKQECNPKYTHKTGEEMHTMSCTVCDQPMGEITCDVTYSYDSTEIAMVGDCADCKHPYTKDVYASIGTKYYESLAEAIKAASAEAEITLLRDINEETNVDKNVIINPNGKTVGLTYTVSSEEEDINKYVKIKGALGADSTVNVTSTNDGEMSVDIEEKFDTNGYYIFDYSMNEDGTYMHIYTADGMRDFAGMVQPGAERFEGKTVRLMADVDLGGKDNPWTAIGNVESYPGYTFAGTFDGRGHTIDNMYVTASGDGGWAAAGLFGSITGKVMNVVIDNAVVISSHYAGGVVGYSSTNVGMEISGCTVRNSQITSAPENLGTDEKPKWDNGDKAGGIIGYSVSGDVVSGNTVENTVIKAYRDIGGIAGYSAGAVTGNSVTDVTLIVDILHNYKNDEYNSIDDHDCDSIIGDSDTTVDSSNTATNVEKFVGIYTKEDMFAFADRVNTDKYTFAGWTVKLMDDIDLGGSESNPWTPIGTSTDNSFEGAFDGQKHTISNLYINKQDAAGVGLFGYSKMTSLKNLVINNVEVTGYQDVSALIGRQTSVSCDISNIKITGDVKLTAKRNAVGTVMGHGAIKSISDVTVEVNEGSSVQYTDTSRSLFGYAGGVWGHCWPTTATNINSNIDVSGTDRAVGGIGGGCAVTSTNVKCTGDVTLDEDLNKVWIHNNGKGNNYDGSLINGLIYGFGVSNLGPATHTNCVADGKLTIGGQVITSLEETDDQTPKTSDNLWENGYKKNDVRFGAPYTKDGVINIVDSNSE